jgi:hypothetical protein
MNYAFVLSLFYFVLTEDLQGGYCCAGLVAVLLPQVASFFCVLLFIRAERDLVFHAVLFDKTFIILCLLSTMYPYTLAAVHTFLQERLSRCWGLTGCYIVQKLATMAVSGWCIWKEPFPVPEDFLIMILVINGFLLMRFLGLLRRTDDYQVAFDRDSITTVEQVLEEDKMRSKNLTSHLLNIMLEAVAGSYIMQDSVIDWEATAHLAQSLLPADSHLLQLIQAYWKPLGTVTEDMEHKTKLWKLMVKNMASDFERGEGSSEDLLTALTTAKKVLDESCDELGLLEAAAAKKQLANAVTSKSIDELKAAIQTAKNLKLPEHDFAKAQEVLREQGSVLLSRGVKCRYESSNYGWMNAVVESYNESDGTYDLDVRRHAWLDKISPEKEVRAMEAWPPGTLATYHSSSVNEWLAAVVVSFNETDSTYNLDVRDHADIDRIRART